MKSASMWSKAHHDFRNFSKRRVNNSQFVTFFGYFLPSYFQKNVQMTLNFQRKLSLFNCIGCINLLTDQYLEIWHTPKNQFLRKFVKKSIFWHYLSFNFCKHVLNVLKILEKLLLYGSTWYLRMIRIASFLHLWRSSKRMLF